MKTSSWLSKSIKITAVLALAAAAIGFVNTAKAVEFDFANTPGSVIDFPGNQTFSFTPTTNNFEVTDGSANGLQGQIGGTFNIGVVTVNGSDESAMVTGTGTFTIHDGANNLTATLNWVDIFQHGSGNTLNDGAQINLTNIMYAGTNTDLLALKNAGSAIIDLTFQFIPPVDLVTLSTGGQDHNTSFSGTVATTVPDGGTTVALLGIALLGIGSVRRMFRARKS